MEVMFLFDMVVCMSESASVISGKLRMTRSALKNIDPNTTASVRVNAMSKPETFQLRCGVAMVSVSA